MSVASLDSVGEYDFDHLVPRSPSPTDRNLSSNSQQLEPKASNTDDKIQDGAHGAGAAHGVDGDELDNNDDKSSLNSDSSGKNNENIDDNASEVSPLYPRSQKDSVVHSDNSSHSRADNDDKVTIPCRNEDIPDNLCPVMEESFHRNEVDSTSDDNEQKKEFSEPSNVIVGRDSDSSMSDADDILANTENQPSSSKRRRVLLSSDEEDDDSDKKEGKEDNEGSERKMENLITNIFGDESDDEKDEAIIRGETYEDGKDLKYGLDEREEETEWDFDIMLRKHNEERRRRRRKRRDGSIYVGSMQDDMIKSLMDAMKLAAKNDRTCNIARKPAVEKRLLLPQVKSTLIKYDLMELIIDNGMLSIVAEWLAPLPDKSLPSLEIRTTLLKILQDYSRLDQGVLKQSGLGRAVMLLSKHPKETNENKILASNLVTEWARPIFHLETDFRCMTNDERLRRDYAALAAAKRRRLVEETSKSNDADKEVGHKVGEKGFILRARVPRVSGKDYFVRPKSSVDGQFRGASKSRMNERLDRARRDFVARTKQNKFRRAVPLSIGGTRNDS